jgi:type VI protein secretion system component Hcp
VVYWPDEQVVPSPITIVKELDKSSRVNGAAHGDEREHISFVYQKIELTDLESNTVAADDWSSFQ